MCLSVDPSLHTFLPVRASAHTHQAPEVRHPRTRLQAFQHPPPHFYCIALFMSVTQGRFVLDLKYFGAALVSTGQKQGYEFGDILRQVVRDTNLLCFVIFHILTFLQQHIVYTTCQSLL